MLHSKIFDYTVIAVLIVVGAVYWSSVFHEIRVAEQNVTVVEKSDLPEGIATAP